MDNSNFASRLNELLLPALDETFEKVQGIYLDKGTSFLETLEIVSPAEASKAASPRNATIAAQVEHVCFYIETLEQVMDGKDIGKVNWKEIWQRRKGVTPEEWDAMRVRLRSAYGRVLEKMRTFDGSESDDVLFVPLAIVIHTAYHLGGLRQALAVLKSEAAGRVA